jgi:hypothetical protein
VTGTMTWAAMDVHARSTYAASLDVINGELSRQRFDTGAVEPAVGWLAGLPGPVRACYEAGPTGFGLYRAAVAAGIDCQVIAPVEDTTSVGGPQQVRSSRYRSVAASADGRPRALVLPLGRRDCPIASTDSPPRSGGEGPGPRSPLARAVLLWAALTRPRPLLDTRPPATKPGTWGSQPPHMRLTDVESFARRLSHPSTVHQPPNNSALHPFRGLRRDTLGSALPPPPEDGCTNGAAGFA